MLEFQQSEQTAERRRWMLHLVDATDGITPETGITGKGYISKNGAAAVQTTNSIVEVDSSNMPGFYYLELTASELDTLGFIGFRFDTAATAEFQDRALVSYNDPFARQGGFVGGSSKGLTEKQAQDIAERVWKVILEDKKTAKEVLLAKSEFDPATDKVQMDLPDYLPAFEKLQGLLEALDGKDTGIGSVLDAIANIKQTDWSGSFADAAAQVTSLEGKLELVVPTLSEFQNTMKSFQGNMGVATKEVAKTLAQIDDIQAGFENLKTMMDEWNTKLDEQTDMDKRFTAMKAQLDKGQLAELGEKLAKFKTDMTEELRQLTLKMIEQKYAIIDELKQ